MKEVTTSSESKDGWIDLWRFVGAIAILMYHVNFAGWSWHPFMNGYIYVEFFYMLSGFLTMRHFSNCNWQQVGDRYNHIFSYCLKKYVRILRYSVVPTLVIYVLTCMKDTNDLRQVIKNILNALVPMTKEVFLLVNDNKIGGAINGPLWFVSVMIVVMPIICLIFSISNKYLIINLALPVIYIIYACIGLSGNTAFPVNFLRATAAMLLGGYFM